MDTQTECRVVDARGMEPPRPMELIMEALDTLPRGAEAVLLLYREPVPLYAILQRNGYRYRLEHHDDGTVAVHIRHAQSGCCGGCGGA